MTESLTQRIHRVYDNLPAGERKAAELVLDSPGELALWAATELSDRAGVSNATVSRLFRRLGYGSYDEARRASREMRASGSPLYLADPAPARGRLADILAVETAVVADSLSMLNPLTVDAVAERMAAARRVRFAGFRNSHFAAAYAASALAQFRPGVALLTAAHQTLAGGIAGVGAGDLVVIVGLRRRPAGFSGFVSAVAATGADVALVTDRSVRGAPAMARWTLTCAVDTPQTLDSYSGALAVLRALVLAAVARLGVAGRRHLERIETLHETLGELE